MAWAIWTPCIFLFFVLYYFCDLHMLLGVNLFLVFCLQPSLLWVISPGKGRPMLPRWLPRKSPGSNGQGKGGMAHRSRRSRPSWAQGPQLCMRTPAHTWYNGASRIKTPLSRTLGPLRSGSKTWSLLKTKPTLWSPPTTYKSSFSGPRPSHRYFSSPSSKDFCPFYLSSPLFLIYLNFTGEHLSPSRPS